MKRFSPRRIIFVLLCAAVLLYLVLPILIVVPMSFSSARFLTFPPPSLSLRWYREYIGSPAWMQATLVTLTVAVCTVAIATPLGVSPPTPSASQSFASCASFTPLCCCR